MKKNSSRTARAIGAAVVAGGMVAGGAQAQETPRGADGHPDLSGMWMGGGTRPDAGVQDFSLAFRGRGGSYVGLEADGGIRRTSNDNQPLYKPEFWDRIIELEYFGNWEDPVDECLPLGNPRGGIPHQIIKVQDEPALILVYDDGFNGYNGSYRSWTRFRWIWTDGRDHEPAYVEYESYFGSSVGTWDGDALVIESIGFTDETWLHKNAWIHGYDMRVIETLTRVGDNLIWQATVEDPEYFQEPWVMTPMVAGHNGPTDADNYIQEGRPCIVREPFGSHTRSG